MNTTIDQMHARPADADKVASSPAYQAFRILHFGFTIAPILAGLDKFFHLLVNWDQYVPGVVAERFTHIRTYADACGGRDRDRSRNRCRAKTEDFRLRCRRLACTDHHKLVANPRVIRRRAA